MSVPGWVWRPPPEWPAPPPGWTPPPGWEPPPDWPPPPEGWDFWVPAAPPPAAPPGRERPPGQERPTPPWPPAPPPPAPPEPAGRPGSAAAGSAVPGSAAPGAQRPAPDGSPAGPEAGLAAGTRRSLVWETWFMQLAFLLPSVVAAIGILAAHLAGGGPVSFFPTVIRGHPVENLILSGASYLAVGALVPLALLLLARTGHLGAPLGLRDRAWRSDLLPGLAIAAAGYGISFIMSGLLLPLLSSHRGLVDQMSIGPVPRYYLLYGLLVAAVTAITEETLVNGYLLTRLEQLGWRPGRALLLSLTLRTSYHLYYGLGLVFTIPLGFFATVSFQKHRRLVRPVAAHFIYDAALITFSVLTAHR